MVTQSKLKTRILILVLFAIFCFSDLLVFLYYYGFDMNVFRRFLSYHKTGILLRAVSFMLMAYPLVKEKLRWLTLAAVALLVVSLYCSPFFYPRVAPGFIAYDLLNIYAFHSLISLAALMACVLIKPSEKRGSFAAKVWFIPTVIQTLFLVFLIYRSFIEEHLSYYHSWYTNLFGESEEVVLLSLIVNIILTVFFYIFSRWLVSPYKELLADAKEKEETFIVYATYGYIRPMKHILLLLFTFGIWNYIWIYRTTKFLNCVESESYRNPTRKLLLCIFIPFYSIYWTYQSARRTDKLAVEKGIFSEIAKPCLLCSFFVTMAAPIMIQEKINTCVQHRSLASDSNTNAPHAASFHAANTSAADELKKFKELLDSGVISQEEFDAKKKQLLGL